MSDVRIIVEYFAHARAAVGGQARETLSVAADAGLREIIHCLAEKHGSKLSALLLAPSTIIAVDGVQISPGDDPTLAGGETVMIIPPISGGQP